jgi:phosphohistidine phosphatase
MKKLIFIRHGKAEDEVNGLSDFERSLTTGGKKICKQAAEIFAGKEDAPGLLISSPAFRALETALIFSGECGTGYDKVILNDVLYFNANIKKLIEILGQNYENEDNITLVGHNPSFSDMAGDLCKNGCDTIPKSGIVCITFDVKSWADIKPHSGILKYFLKPGKE